MKQKTNFKQTEIGKIPEDWMVKNLKEVCIKITDGSHFSPPTKPNGKLIATVKDMADYGFNFSTCRLISKEDFDKLVAQDCRPLKDDVLIAKDGSYLKHVFVSNGKYEIVILSSIAILRPNQKKILPLFLKYLFIDTRTKERVSGNYVSGAVIPRIVLRDFEKIDLPIPPLPEQHAIASILSSLDAKIELNNKMNKTLEAIGQVLFKRWFVDFEFPNEEGKPYKSSGGKIVESELGEIPEGWKVEELNKFGDIVCGKTPPKSHKEYFGGDVPFIKIPDMHNQIFIINTEDSLTEYGKSFQKNKTIPQKSICVSCIATVGLVAITIKESQTNQQINSIIPHHNYSTSYLYYLLKNMKRSLNDMGSGGSATLNINTNQFSNIHVLIPPEHILSNYHFFTDRLFDRVLSNSLESQKLSKIRDILLPKLMSGEIRVK